MRMIPQVAGPSLQQGGQTQFGAEIFGLGGEILQRPGAFFQQRAIPKFLGGPDGFAQLGGHGEGDQEIGDGQQPGALSGQPLVRRPDDRSGDRLGGCRNDRRNVPGRRRSGSVARPAPGSGTAGWRARPNGSRILSDFLGS